MPFGAFPLQAATISVGGLSLFSTEVAEMTAKTYMPKIWLTPGTGTRQVTNQQEQILSRNPGRYALR